MKPINTYISVADPCHEDWDKMSAVDKGRYCASCQKTVIDFTLMNDGEVLDIFEEAKNGSPCGRFLNTQLDRPLVDNRYKPSFIAQVAKRAAAILLLLQAGTTALLAQQVKKKPVAAVQHADKNTKKLTHLRQITGRVLEPDKHTGAWGVTVHVKDLGLTAVTDSTGAFTITLPDTLTATQIVLDGKIVGEGASVLEATIDIRANACSNVTLYLQRITDIKDLTAVSPSMYMVQGGGRPLHVARDGGRISGVQYVIDGVQPEKPTFWQRITKPFRKSKK